jgi:hypothetical protein
MIKFFQKIRQSLLTENKFGKYVLYAIGEIFLVMIGILMALQVNNWNERRKSDQIGKIYINEIYKDLKKDIVILEEVLARLQEQSITAEKILTIYDSPGHPITDTLEFTRNFSASSWPLIVEREQDTYSDLMASGKGSLLKDDKLIELLHLFYKDYDTKIANFNEFPKAVRFDKRAISMQLGTLSDFKSFNKTGQYSHEYIIRVLENKEFYSMTLGIYKSCFYNIEFFEEVLMQAENVLTYIEKNQPDKI